MHKKTKRHIALLLVLLMVFPLVNNTLHFVFNDHNRRQEVTHLFLIVEIEKSKHICSQDLFSISTFVNLTLFDRHFLDKRISQIINSFNDENFKTNHLKSSSIRGPPLA
jgi:hypothetical protein